MDTLKIKTLDQVDDALEAVESARADQSLAPAQRFVLENAAVKLRNIERSIIKLVQQELVDSLISDATALVAIADEMKKSAEKLAAVSSLVEKAANVVGAFVKIVTTVAASGLL